MDLKKLSDLLMGLKVLFDNLLNMTANLKQSCIIRESLVV
jgi:hypothetical protein